MLRHSHAKAQSGDKCAQNDKHKRTRREADILTINSVIQEPLRRVLFDQSRFLVEIPLLQYRVSDLEPVDVLQHFLAFIENKKILLTVMGSLSPILILIKQLISFDYNAGNNDV